MKKLGFGAMRLPIVEPSDEGSVDTALTQKMVDLFMEQGGFLLRHGIYVLR